MITKLRKDTVILDQKVRYRCLNSVLFLGNTRQENKDMLLEHLHSISLSFC